MTNKFIEKIKKKFKNFIFPEINEIIMKKELIENIINIAKDSYPKEFLAWMIGNNRKGVLMIENLEMQTYYANNNSAIFEPTWLPNTSNIIGTVHSHPGYSNRASRADLRVFNKRGLIHAIICMPYTQETIQFYDKYGEKINIKIE